RPLERIAIIDAHRVAAGFARDLRRPCGMRISGKTDAARRSAAVPAAPAQNDTAQRTATTRITASGPRRPAAWISSAARVTAAVPAVRPGRQRIGRQEQAQNRVGPLERAADRILI